MSKDNDHIDTVADIVSAYVSNNPVPSANLAELIATVSRSLKSLGTVEAKPVDQSPAIDPKRSVKQDAITCLECGKSFKSLKRHIGANHGLSPEEYRQKWQLPASYPMVSPAYASARSDLAKTIGLGRKPSRKRKSPTR